MDITDTPADVPAPDEDRPAFEEWDDPEDVMRDGPIRERLRDVMLQIRTPTKVSTIADRAKCDTETAREYLQWFAELGLVREQPGRPVRYERNDSYLRWRRIERIQETYTEAEIVEELQTALEDRDAYRDRFDADTPADVSLADASEDRPLEDVWEDLTTWKTLERRVDLLDAARRESDPSGDVSAVDA